MREKNYTTNDILVGIYANFPEDFKTFDVDTNKFQKFFYDNRDVYSVLRYIPFDEKGLFAPRSEDLEEAQGDLFKTHLMFYSDYYKKNTIYHSLIIRWENSSKKKFEDLELLELKHLSREFVGCFR